MLIKTDNDKVCAVVCNRDEVSLFESVKSIINSVDFVLIVDCSKDKTLTENTYNHFKDTNKIKKIYTEMNYRKQNIIAFNEIHSDYRWFLRWDSDFVAVDETREAINILKRLVGEKISIRWYVKTNTDDSLHSEPYMMTMTDELLKNHLRRRLGNLFVKKKHAFPLFPIPYDYKKLDIDLVMAIHLQKEKPIWRLEEKEKQAKIARDY